MIDLKELRDHPDRFRNGVRDKCMEVDIDRLLALDEARRAILARQETARAEQNRLGKETGPKMGALKTKLKGAIGEEKSQLERELAELEQKPAVLKAEVQECEARINAIEPEWRSLWMQVPQPPSDDVPKGKGADDNVEIRRWSPTGWDFNKSFEANRGFKPRTHLELVKMHGLVDFERGVKMSGTRHYVMWGLGMRLHQAVLRYAVDFMADRRGFSPMGVPVIVKEECMVLHADEILPLESLPLKYCTVSTCFRREAGAAGKDTAGLYRIHQFDKVEQVVVCRADEAESRAWHAQMIETVEMILQSLGLAYRLLQCCTGDLGVKNEDMIDIESWMPGRGEIGADGAPTGAFGETHSASRLNDFQCRRLNLRYKDETGKMRFAYALNNTVIASPRVLIPLLEMHQQADGSVVVPEVLRPYMGGIARIG